MTKRSRARVVDDQPEVIIGLRDALERWGLHDIAKGVSSRIKCKLAAVCSTDADERARIRAGVPALCASRDYAADVFAALEGRDAIEWATESAWSAFGERGKVAMVSGWGAPGSHLLSNRDMIIVHSFGEVLKGEKPLNLQMFHREDTSVPVMARKLRWPAETDFFDVDTGASAPGRLLDDATRVSARGAMTWWHLDDCGEFVCQVGLPETREAGDDVLLGPTGKPVVKLFFFAERKDYAWIAQDAEMNKSMRISALEVFDTPGHYYPTASEMQTPSSTPLDVESPKAFDGVKAEDADDPCPVLWVAALEAGGPPLLSPPNIIHCVLTVRDCVMCEERRLSLAFMDEVLYFQRRAMRWCEPPIFYSFVREDLKDPQKARDNAVRPLATMLSDLKCTGSSNDDAFRFARCLTSLQVLANHAPEFYALTADGVAEAREHVDAAISWMAEDSSGFCAKVRGAMSSDPRTMEDALLSESMANEMLGTHDLGNGRFCAVVHEKGRPRWGPVRNSTSLVAKDRKDMKSAIRSGALDTLLLEYRRNILDSLD